MQIEKNQGKIKFCIMGANFCNNLHLPLLHLHLICIRGCGFFFFHFFLSLLAFSLPLYFLFENGIDPAFSFIMSYCLCIENENNLQF